MKKLILFVLLINCWYAGIKAQSRALVFATYTYATNDRLSNLEPVAEYLSEKTGLDIRAVSYPTVQELISAIKKGLVDFAMINTSGYLVLQRNHPGIADPLVSLDLGNALVTNYGACLIANKQSAIKSIDDLKTGNRTHSLALVGSSSTSGNLVPRLLLNRMGIPDAEALLQVNYAGTHRKVVENVLDGRASVGGCGCAEIDSARQHLDFDGKAIILDSFINIPLGPIVYNKKTDAAIVASVLENLLRIHEDNNHAFVNFCKGWTEFKEAIRFKRVTDYEYDNFRKLFGNNQKLWKLIE